MALLNPGGVDLLDSGRNGTASTGGPGILPPPPTLEEERTKILPQISPNTNPTPTLNGVPSGTTQLTTGGPSVVPVAQGGTPWYARTVTLAGRAVPVWTLGLAALAGWWLLAARRKRRG